MELYPYQKTVKTLLESGQSVILQAPTGAGKTRAALAPFIENFFDHPESFFPRKCIYAVPMRVLANQFVAEYSGLAASYHRKHDRKTELKVRIQTGEQSDDPRFNADLIFATIDQVLSSFLHMPYSLSRKEANLNAGAIVASYLVFDEFHLFDPASTLPTTLQMLQMLSGVTPFMLMTATFSSHMLDQLADLLKAKVVPIDGRQRHEMLNLPVERTKTRYYHWAGTALSAEAIIERHHHRSLVVCNSVARAQTIYGDLCKNPSLHDTEVILLHSRFLPEHRAFKERRIKELLGKEVDRTQGSAIVVATQVVEVGLDISAEVLHTELSPANAILQRAGRCARFQNETGNVYVYPVDDVLPYKGQEDIFQLTQTWLEEHNDSPVNFIHEQELVDFAHGQSDGRMIEGVKGGSWKHYQRMKAALNGDREAAGDLVRKIASQQITISADPEKLLPYPFAAPMFSLHPGTVQKAVKIWLEDENLDGLEDLVWRLEEDSGGGEENDVLRYFWQPIRDKSLVRGSALIAIHPAVADYNPDQGLILGQAGSFRAEDEIGRAGKSIKKNKDWVSYYQLESYQQHIHLVYRAFNQTTWKELERAATMLEQRAGWPKGWIRRTASLAVLFHDLGKLAKEWQRWVVDWQKSINAPMPPDFWAAHTDFDGYNKEHVDRQKKMRKRPPHAVESAVIGSPVLAAALGEYPELLKVAFSAIARHHGAFSTSIKAYELSPQAQDAVRGTLSLAAEYTTGFNLAALRMSDDPNRTTIRHISPILVDASDTNELLAYMLVARALRLADQMGTAAGSK